MNELNRRFEVMHDSVTQEEKIMVIDKFCQQLINSGYSYIQIREIILSSLKGYARKEKLRDKNKRKYKSASETLETRMEKKLIEAVAWYRQEMRKEENEEDWDDDFKREDGSWKQWRKEGKRNKTKINEDKMRNKKRKEEKERLKEDKKIVFGEEEEKYQTVIFIEHTEESTLAKRIREKLRSIEDIGRVKVKIVERAGDKIVDLLHRSNPWDNTDCERKDCLMCSSVTEGGRKGLCKKRNVVYETYCEICGTVREEEIEKESELKGKRKREKVNEKKERMKKNERKEYRYKYIGETNKSGYE